MIPYPWSGWSANAIRIWKTARAIGRSGSKGFGMTRAVYRGTDISANRCYLSQIRLATTTCVRSRCPAERVKALEPLPIRFQLAKVVHHSLDRRGGAGVRVHNRAAHRDRAAVAPALLRRQAGR